MISIKSKAFRPKTHRTGANLNFIKTIVSTSISFLLGLISYISFNLRDENFQGTGWLPRIMNVTLNIKDEHVQPNITEQKKCIERTFANTLLVIGFGAPSEYESIPLFELLYKKVFIHRLYCGSVNLQNQTEINILVVDTRNGAFLYECLRKAMDKYTSFTGYLYIGEDILINYWNMLNLDLGKIWEDGSLQQGPVLYEQSSGAWEWFQSPWGRQAMEKVFEYFVELNYYDNRKAKQNQGDWVPYWDVSQSLNKWLWNGKGSYACYSSNKSIVYIPRPYAPIFANISKHFRASGVRQEIALPSIIRLITLEKLNQKLTSVEINQENRKIFLDERSTLMDASQQSHMIAITGNRKERREILNHLRLKEYAVGRFLEYKQC